jgi:hypothetical protein
MVQSLQEDGLYNAHVCLAVLAWNASGIKDTSKHVTTSVAGVLRQVEAVLKPEASFSDFLNHHNADLWFTWAYACRYHVESILKSVEARMMQLPSETFNDMAKATDCAANLPSSSAHAACSSLLRLLDMEHKKTTPSGPLPSWGGANVQFSY